MTSRAGTPRSITDRLDSLENKLKAEILACELRLTDKIAVVARDLAALAQDFREFKGTFKGVAVAMVTLIPLVTVVAGAAVNYLLFRQVGFR